jgi:polar amino acid transport system substrate-binding protein
MKNVHTLKRALVVVVGAAMLLSACGDDDNSTGTAATGGKLDGVNLVSKGKLTTCTHLPYAPFQSEEGGKVVGFDVDMIDLVAKELGITQTVVDTPFETIKTGADLNAGKCDVAAAGMTITDERKKNIDFSVPYFDATQALMAKKGSGFKSMADLKGKKLGTQSGTTGEDYAKANGSGATLISFETSEAELTALKSGQVDAVIQDNPVVALWLKDATAYEIAVDFNTGEQYGFAVKKDGNDKLLAAIDAAITKAKADGTYAKLYKQWLGIDPPKV